MVEEQIVLLKEMGHRMEDYNRTKQDHAHSKQDKTIDHNSKWGSDQKYKPRDKKEFRKDKGKKVDWKERTVELKGIPADILKERRELDDCQKCGKTGHKWFECWTKELVTRRTSSGKASQLKNNVKIAALGEELTTLERIMEIDSESDYELLLEKREVLA